MQNFVVTALVMLLGTACTRSESPPPERKPSAVTSTTMLASMAQALAGDHVDVECLLAPGVDPHLYQPRPRDAKKVAAADLVISSGLGLEGWIDGLLRNAGGNARIVNASQGVTPIKMGGDNDAVDPHFWFDLGAWKVATTTVGAELDTLLTGDSEAQARVARNLKDYFDTLDRLEAWVKEQLGKIPENKRVLITSHDAFNYFGRAFELEVVGVQGLSTQEEAGQRDLARVVDLIRSRSVEAVFMESSVNPRLVKKIADETGVKIRGPLFSDSTGEPGTPAATFVGTVAENVRIITEGLGQSVTPFQSTAQTATSAR